MYYFIYIILAVTLRQPVMSNMEDNGVAMMESDGDNVS
jgi:hypothetical protein